LIIGKDFKYLSQLELCKVTNNNDNSINLENVIRGLSMSTTLGGKNSIPAKNQGSFKNPLLVRI